MWTPFIFVHVLHVRRLTVSSYTSPTQQPIASLVKPKIRGVWIDIRQNCQNIIIFKDKKNYREIIFEHSFCDNYISHIHIIFLFYLFIALSFVQISIFSL